MTARAEDLDHLPYWPRLLSRVQAAAYMGMAPGTFSARVKVKPLSVGRRKLWDRLDLDTWVDALSGKPHLGAGRSDPEVEEYRRRARQNEDGPTVS